MNGGQSLHCVEKTTSLIDQDGLWQASVGAHSALAIWIFFGAFLANHDEKEAHHGATGLDMLGVGVLNDTFDSLGVDYCIGSELNDHNTTDRCVLSSTLHDLK